MTCVRCALPGIGAVVFLSVCAGLWCFGLSIAACGGAEGAGLSRVRRTGELRWGGDLQGGEPFAFEDPERPGELTGFEAELVAAIARELGVRPVFVQQDWSNLVPSLERNSFDIVFNGLEVTPARADWLRLSRPYFVFSEQLVTRVNDAHATSLNALRGHRVGTLANSLAYDVLQALGGCEIVPYEGNEEPYSDLEQGRLDGVLLDDVIVARYAQRPTLHVVEEVRTGYYVAACRKTDEDLCDAIDAVLDKLASSGQLRQILRRFGVDNARQAQLETWTPQDTRALLRVTRHAQFGLHHVWLFLQGAVVTFVVSSAAMLIAITLGMLLALARKYGGSVAAFCATLYIELFRGTPALLQLYLLYFGIMPAVRTTLGFNVGADSDAAVAAVLGLGLNYAAYEAEVYRAGMQAVPVGQMEAAMVLGMGKWLALRRVIVPQAVRVALPGVTNDFIALLKDSSLVSVITVVELTKHMAITAVDVRSWVLPGAVCAALYMAMSYPLSKLSRYLEARLERL